MATVTLTFEANAGQLTIIDENGNRKSYGHEAGVKGESFADAAVRAVLNEFRANSTASGTITVTAS